MELSKHGSSHFSDVAGGNPKISHVSPCPQSGWNSQPAKAEACRDEIGYDWTDMVNLCLSPSLISEDIYLKTMICSITVAGAQHNSSLIQVTTVWPWSRVHIQIHQQLVLPLTSRDAVDIKHSAIKEWVINEIHIPKEANPCKSCISCLYMCLLSFLYSHQELGIFPNETKSWLGFQTRLRHVVAGYIQSDHWQYSPPHGGTWLARSFAKSHMICRFAY